MEASDEVTQVFGKTGGRRVLAVDDDPEILTMLVRMLTREGFDAAGVPGAQQALEVIQREAPDVVLLDVNLEGADGFDVLAEVRQRLDLPVILVTGRGTEPDRVLGLRMGADDYVVKPFSNAELVARIDTILQRRQVRPPGSVRRYGPLQIDLSSHEVTVDGRLIATTAKEFELLTFLSSSPRQVFSREQLLQQVWESSAQWQDQATVTEHIRRLRLKIEPTPDRPRWLITVRGTGYRFDP